jgi:hypothetical protein|tara:strand:- start:26 stop:1903 length:1878 start_codon:yes stop_codon:yes gene_type:complete
MAESKEITYLNKDFDSFKQKLIEFAEVYYPNTYNDFSDTSAGMMLIEMSAYIGDVLSFYGDNQVQENFLQFAKQRSSLLSLAYNHGYFPQVTNASSVDVNIFQTIPATIEGGRVSPDFNYAMIIEEGAQVQASTNTSQLFYLENKIDFTVSGSADPTDISVYSLDSNNQPNFYLLKKRSRASAGTLKTTTFSFTTPQRFNTVQVEDDNVIEITRITDTNGARWYEVPYLAQETIFDSQTNIAANDPELYQYNETTPYLLKIKKVPKRFIKRFKTNNTVELQFGPGVSSGQDETITPNSDNVGMGLPYGTDKLLTAYDPSNFLYTRTYGLSPSNTTLTVEYLVGGGATSNVPVNSITQLSSGTVTFFGTSLDSTLQSTVRDSLAFNNPNAATGGGDGDTNEDVRQNAIAQYPTQLRTVTKDDYSIRSLSLPSKYGVVSKVYITQNSGISPNRRTPEGSYDTNVLDLYLLSRNTTGKLSIADPALKQNLITYLGEYRMLTDAVVIKDAFIINIGVNFDVILQPNFNNRVILNNCINALIAYFDIDRWQLNQPILINNVRNVLDNIEGIQTVKKLEIVNKVGTNENYSEFAYDMNGATIDEVLYPSLDPSIFELKFPDTDIQGRVVTN